MSSGAGDKLAQGGVKAQFPPMGSGMTQEQWDNMWKDDDKQLKLFPEDSNCNPNAAPTGVPCTDTGKTESSQR